MSWSFFNEIEDWWNLWYAFSVFLVQVTGYYWEQISYYSGFIGHLQFKKIVRKKKLHFPSSLFHCYSFSFQDVTVELIAIYFLVNSKFLFIAFCNRDFVIAKWIFFPLVCTFLEVVDDVHDTHSLLCRKDFVKRHAVAPIFPNTINKALYYRIEKQEARRFFTTLKSS